MNKKISQFLFAAAIAGCITSCTATVLLAQTPEEEPTIQFQRPSEPIPLGPVEIETIDAPGVAVAEDQQGFMWFGGGTSGGGLYRYDGYDYKNYQNNPQDTTSLAHNWVETLHADSAGTLWVGMHGGGLDRFDPVTETFTHYSNDPGNPLSLSQDTVTVILEDSKGTLWVGTHGGLNSFNRETGTFTRYRHDPDDPASLSNDQVRVLHEDSFGMLWVGTGSPALSETPAGMGGLNRFHPETGTFSRYMHDPDDPKSLPDNKVTLIYEDSRGTFWVGTLNNGLHTMDRNAGTFTRFLYDPNSPNAGSHPYLQEYTDEFDEPCQGFNCRWVTFIFEDSQGMLWIGGYGSGVTRYDPQTGAMSHHDTDNSGLQSNSIWGMTESADGTLWLGTLSGSGMHKVTSAAITFPLIVPESSPGDNPAGARYVNSFFEEPDGTLWIATEQGLNQRDPSSGLIRRYRHDPDDTNSLQPGALLSLYGERDGELWIGYGGAASRLDLTSERFRHFNFDDPSTLPDGWVLDIQEDSRGNLWFVSDWRGLTRYDPSSDTFLRYLFDPDDPGSISDNITLSLFKDRSGTLWIGTKSGLNRLEVGPEEDSFTKYIHSHEVVAMLEGLQGRFWVGTRDDGLHLLDIATGSSMRYGPEEGLALASIANILEDDNGYLWISTAQGSLSSPHGGRLSRFNPSDGSFTNYGVADGLPDIGFFVNSALKLRDGRLLFGGDTGYTVFDPGTIPEPIRYRPPMTLSGLRVRNQEILPGPEGLLKDPLFETKEIRLSSDQSDFTIGYTALSYRNPQEIQYRYVLENLDPEWVNARKQRSARYSRVPPGSYTFRVQAVDSRGFESEVASIGVTILPPWWQTWWAYGFYALFFAAGVFAVDRTQRRRVIAKEREKARERELEQAREIEKAYQNLEVAHQNLKSAQNQLVQQEKLASLGQLTAGIAHEIKNPLNFVNNFSDLSVELIQEALDELEKYPSESEEVDKILKDIKSNLRKIHEHGTRADSIVKSMLQHSRGGDGKMQPIALNPLIKEYVNLAFHGMRAGKEPINVDIDLQLDESIGEVPLVAEDFSRVILNLVNNAFDAMREKGIKNSELKIKNYSPRLTVRTKAENGNVVVEIQDNGPGVPAEIKDKILQPFFTTKKGTQGTGLGLSITNDIIKAHGGQLDIKTEEGNGSVFVISLPSVGTAD